MESYKIPTENQKRQKKDGREIQEGRQAMQTHCDKYGSY
jgi:hypothetical protein